MVLAQQLSVSRLSFTGRLLLSPIDIYGTLQGLGLKPAWPLLPGPSTWSFQSLFAPAIPSFPGQWTVTTSADYVVAVALSPVVLRLFRIGLHTILGNCINRYFTIAIPRPGYPDQYSIQASDGERWANVHERLCSQRPTLWTEFRKDLGPILEGLQSFRTLLEPFEQFLGSRTLPSSSSHVSDPRTPLRRTSQTTRFTPNGMLVEEPTRINTILASAVDGTRSVALPSYPSQHSPIRHSHSTWDEVSSFSDSSRPTSPSGEPSNVLITTRHGSTDTLHMQVELSNAAPGAPVVTSSFSASPRPAVVTTTTITRDGATPGTCLLLPSHSPPPVPRQLRAHLTSFLLPRLPSDPVFASSAPDRENRTSLPCHRALHLPRRLPHEAPHLHHRLHPQSPPRRPLLPQRRPHLPRPSRALARGRGRRQGARGQRLSARSVVRRTCGGARRPRLRGQAGRLHRHGGGGGVLGVAGGDGRGVVGGEEVLWLGLALISNECPRWLKASLGRCLRGSHVLGPIGRSMVLVQEFVGEASTAAEQDVQQSKLVANHRRDMITSQGTG